MRGVRRSLPPLATIEEMRDGRRPAEGVMFEKGDSIEGFELVQRLGKGGFATVWLARGLDDDREVAIKILNLPREPSPSRGPSVAERFLEEARILQSTSAPGLIRVHSVIERRAENLLAYVMEHERGRDLLAVLPTLDLAELTTIMADVADTLGMLHGRGVIHRDIKLTNILISEGPRGTRVAKLIDFGVAKDLDARSMITNTATGEIVGTLQSMAPETFRRLSGDRVQADASVDQWGMGVALYHALSGRPPFDSDAIFDLINQVESSPTPPLVILARFQPGPFAPVLDRLVRQCLVKDPAKRFGSITDLGRLLRRISADFRAATARPADARMLANAAAKTMVFDKRAAAKTEETGWAALHTMMADDTADPAAADAPTEPEGEETLVVDARTEIEHGPSSASPDSDGEEARTDLALPPVSAPPPDRRFSFAAVLLIAGVAFFLGWLLSRS